MTFNPEEWRKLSERQRQAIIRKIEREEKRAKTTIVVMVYILVFAFLLFLFAVMSSCPTPQDAAPTGQEYETQARHKQSRPALPFVASCAFKSPATAGLIHTPRAVMLDQEVKNFLWRQALMHVDRNRRVAQDKHFADVSISTCEAERPLNSLRVGVRGIVQAVVIAADAWVTLHRFVSDE